jgi:hypothetical protein
MEPLWGLSSKDAIMVLSLHKCIPASRSGAEVLVLVY